MKNLSSYKKGIFLIILSGFGFAVMNVCVTLSGDLPVFQKALFRNGGAMILALIIFLRSKEKFVSDKKSLSFLFLRATLGTVGILANFYALDHLKVSDASMLNKLAPFFTLIFSALFLREKTTLKQYLFVIGAFLGTLFIVKPSGGLTEEAFAASMGVFGGLTAGAAYTIVRYLGKRKMPSCQIVFVFSLFSTLAAIPFVIRDHQAMSLQQVILLVIASMGATTGQFCITLAYKAAPSKEISIFDYFSVAFSAIFGFVFLGQVPDVLSFIGYMIIFLMAYLMFLYNRREK